MIEWLSLLVLAVFVWVASKVVSAVLRWLVPVLLLIALYWAIYGF